MDVENQQIRSYKDLKIWQNGFEIVKVVYAITKQIPKEELYGLVSQMRRSAISIPSNIAEGRGRKTKKKILFNFSTLPKVHFQSLKPNCYLLSHYIKTLIYLTC